MHNAELMQTDHDRTNIISDDDLPLSTAPPPPPSTVDNEEPRACTGHRGLQVEAREKLQVVKNSGQVIKKYSETCHEMEQGTTSNMPLTKSHNQKVSTDTLSTWVVLTFMTYKFQETISGSGLRSGGGPSLHGFSTVHS